MSAGESKAWKAMDAERKALEAEKSRLAKNHAEALLRWGQRYRDTAIFRDRVARLRRLESAITDREVCLYGCM